MIKPNIPEQDLEKVRDIVARTLAKRFTPEEFVFDPIVVTPDFDHDGDEILRVQIIFDGDPKNLDRRWEAGMFPLINPKLDKLGITARLHPLFIERSEWEDPAYDILYWEYK